MNGLSSRTFQRLLVESLDVVCKAAGVSRAEFDAWWRRELEARQPKMQGSERVRCRKPVEIVRDSRGIPHIFAENDSDLFFAYGYAMAQDRLWQMDYLRRKAVGRLSEVLGEEGLPLDRLARTVGLHRIAAAEVEQLPPDTLDSLNAFARGVNAHIEAVRDRLPFEFEMLGYAPEPWSALDSVAIWGEFRWYLTGRFPVIVLPELAKRHLNDDALYRAFLTPEAGDESILPPGSYRSVAPSVGLPVGSHPFDGEGSNNWIAGGSRTASGLPLLASDPHIAFGALSCWYVAHLSGGSYNVAGGCYIGVPGVLLGRNERVAWGITNNICSQRDLYLEQTDPAHPKCFLYDGEWEPWQERVEEIRVRGGATVSHTVISSRNGPIVDELLPAPATSTGPVSLRWLGAEYCESIPCILATNRAQSSDEFRNALRGWRVPTWNFVFADVDGHIGYQAVGQLPIRTNWDRGYRPGWDPAHQWNDFIPAEEMPALADPPQGWIRTANNRNAPDDFPYPLSGTWPSGHRARRIRQMLEAQNRCTIEDMVQMQHDVTMLRAAEATPHLLRHLADASDPRIARAREVLAAWDYRMSTESVGATIFEVFFRRWTEAVAAERFAPKLVPHMASAINGLALALLEGDTFGWFVAGDVAARVVQVFDTALDEIVQRMGPEMDGWQWGKLHTITLHHFLSAHGALGELLNRGGLPVGGNAFTVCNTGYDADYNVVAGANYRIIADLSTSPPTLYAADSSGQSGHPLSPHYCDQLEDWLAGRYHRLPLDRAELVAGETLTLQPVDA